MKKIAITSIILLSTILFSSSSFGKWVLVSTQKNGDRYYYDDINIRKDNGFIYFWRLVSINTPTKEGTQSGAIYRQGDCSIFRLKNLFFVGAGTHPGAGLPGVVSSAKVVEQLLRDQ